MKVYLVIEHRAYEDIIHVFKNKEDAENFMLSLDTYKVSLVAREVIE
jgi:hypothetical protein